MLRSHQAKANANANFSLIFDITQCEYWSRKQQHSDVAFAWCEMYVVDCPSQDNLWLLGYETSKAFFFLKFVGLHYPPHFDFGFSEKKTSPDGNFPQTTKNLNFSFFILGFPQLLENLEKMTIVFPVLEKYWNFIILFKILEKWE